MEFENSKQKASKLENINFTNRAPFKENLDFDKKVDIQSAFGIKNIAKTLSHIIIRKPEDKGMMIGIFGKWGRGKTYLADKIWEYMEREEPNYIRVDFSAWKYQDTKESWAYLYEVMMEQYLIDKNENFSLDWLRKLDYQPFVKIVDNLEITMNEYIKFAKLNIKKIGWVPILLFLATFIWFFSVEKIGLFLSLGSVFGIALLIKFIVFYFLHKTTAIELYKQYFSKTSFNSYLGVQAEIEKELSVLLTTWIDNTEKKVVLFVDDIDRCNIEQIVNIIDGLRVILDNPKIYERIIIITLIDERILKEALIKKYSTFDNTAYREYLEKIFIIGLKLNKLTEYEIEDYLNKILPEYKIVEEKILVQAGETRWKKKSSEGILCLEEIPSKYKKIQRQEEIVKGYDTQDDKVANFTRYTYISKNIDDKQVTEKMYASDNHIEITEDGALYFKERFKKLDDVTPRRMRIFYYKFSIMKRLLYMRMKENDLLKKWNKEIEEKMIIDILLHYSNGATEEFKSGKSKEINEELIYVAKMVSVF